MSFLAGRLAGKEGAFFFQESKQAVGKLVEKNSVSKKLEGPSSSSSSSLLSAEHEGHADVLPEVLRHSLPAKVFKTDTPLEPSSYSASKWVLHSDPKTASSFSSDALNPLRAYVSLPQVTFGPKRWQVPSAASTVSASTANELRQDKHVPINPEKLKAAAEGLANVGKAFAIATAIVFGGTTVVFGVAASKLELQSVSDIKTKGKDLVEPRFENMREQFVPFKIWAENMSRKWHIEREEDIKQKPIVKELSKILGAKSSQ
ncbi:hypothetical protein L6164_029121 [Bauhinia variegata]|uniref:Uncharacterized protein n=1 Tax=Bauhinia variegata TaxID=167791 RepID=A0ACB9L8N3_BAUVA|nr:hypothetical protein L6164_029121 [Bauhinia variegata]